MHIVKVYGRDDCPDTQHALAYLDSIQVKHEYINIDEDIEGEEFVTAHNEGKRRVPTIDIDGEILTEPSDSELETALRERKLA